MKLDVVVEETLAYPVEKVWSALTSAEAISEWLMRTDGFRPEVGARFRMQTGRMSPTGWVEAEVLELVPPSRMVWSWVPGDGAPPTTVTFELAPQPGGTRLRLTHVGDIDATIGGLLREGWPGRIDELRRTLG